MKAIIITCCLFGAVLTNPIFQNIVSVSSELNSNSTESVSVSHSAENDTSELQSSEETTSNQSSESESIETTSEDKTSEESDSLSEESEDVGMDSQAETRDDSMGSEENVRKNWVPIFATVIKLLSAEDNSAEVKGQSENLSNELSENPHDGSRTNTPVPVTPSDSSDSADSSSSDLKDVTASSRDSSQSTSSESSESAHASDSSAEDSESAELQPTRGTDCVNGTRSCESEEYFFQSIGDDAQFSMDNLMMPEEDERELILR